MPFAPCLPATALHMSRYGVGQDNPTFPRCLNLRQRMKGLMIEFTQRSFFEVR